MVSFSPPAEPANAKAPEDTPPPPPPPVAAAGAKTMHKNGDGNKAGMENVREHLSSPPTRDNEIARYEFDSKIPKGHRTDRDKKRLKRHSPDAHVAPFPRTDAGNGESPLELSKHLKRLRTSRPCRPEVKKLRSQNEEEIYAKAAVVVENKVAAKHDEQGDQGASEVEKLQDKGELGAEENTGPPPAAEDKQDGAATKASSPLAIRAAVGISDDATQVPTMQEPCADNANDTQREALDKSMVEAEIKQNVDERVAVENNTETVGKADDDRILAPPELDTSLSLGLSNPHQVLKRTKSVQSNSQAETFSHGVTTSLSLSCSHQFTHNPSCSLTQTSHDYQEFSSASQPVHQGGSREGARKMELAEYACGQGHKGKAVSESNHLSRYGRSKAGIERKQVKSTGFSKSTGTWERWNEVDRSATLRVTAREIVAGPVPVVAQKMRNLPPETLDELKASVKRLLESSERREEFLQLQRTLQIRNDLSSDVLHMSHRTQLEILVALKTGNQAFLLQENHVKLLVEVLLSLRCPNVQCLSQLPFDNCECRICTQKNGFCNACMCVVCSKFDLEHSTCSWVGCDYCIHWCHMDCGLRKFYIKLGPTLRGMSGTSEMQFHCIACGHTSELFGFVKEVFTSCAKTWNRGALMKELDCVRRMFHGSEDMRGRQLCKRASQLIGELENNSDVTETCNAMLMFFEDAKNAPVVGDGDHVHVTDGRVDASTVLERATLALQTYDRVLEEKRTDAAEMQYARARKKSEIEELESIVRIKQAEAKMFQIRADEAAREAEGLQRIVLAKCLKVEEEYAARKSKLQILEAEEKRKRKFDDLQLLERGSYNFEIVRKLMGDLQCLLESMEAAKRPNAEEVSGLEALQRYLQSRAI